MVYRSLTGLLLLTSLSLSLSADAQQAGNATDTHSGASFAVENPLTSSGPAGSSARASSSAGAAKKSHTDAPKHVKEASKDSAKSHHTDQAKESGKTHHSEQSSDSGSGKRHHSDHSDASDRPHHSDHSDASDKPHHTKHVASDDTPHHSKKHTHKDSAQATTSDEEAALAARRERRLKRLAAKQEAALLRKQKADEKLAAAGTVTTAGSADAVLSQTKPDGSSAARNLTDHTVANPLVAVGDAWKMLAYLLPMLIFVVVCLNVLRRYKQQKGQLPGFLQSKTRTVSTSPKTGGLWSALLGSFHLNNARESGGAGIRVIESVPVGGANLHLVQVRGRMLLLGATGTGVNVLTEFREQEGIESDDFRAMLHAAASDLDTLDLSAPEQPVSAVVGSLEDVMRDTGESVQRKIRRLRTVQEAEESVD